MRDQSDVRGSCAQKGSMEFRNLLKKEIELRGLKGKIRLNKAGCLGTCKQGISMVIYPQGIWYGKLRESDISEIIEKTLINDEVIDRLLMSFMKNRPK